MKNRVLCCLLCLTMAVSIIGTAYAEEGIMPCYTYASSVGAALTISDGTAKAAGKINPTTNMRTSITVRLQRENSSGSWSTISTWTGSNASGMSQAGGTKALTTGYNYRVYVTGKIYNVAGTVVETVDKYSETKAY